MFFYKFTRDDVLGQMVLIFFLKTW